jgi:uncharacterized membrane protein YedE/YeeE
MMWPNLSEGLLAAVSGGFGGIILGLAARLGRFCTLGAIEDLLYGRNAERLSTWMLAIGVAIIGTFGLSLFGLVALGDTLYLSAPFSPLVSSLGGVMFGYGMALAGSCAFGALARLGGGDLKSFVIVLVIGVAAYTALSGPFAALRVWATASTRVDQHAMGISGVIGEATGLPHQSVGLMIGLVLVLVFLGTPSLRPRASAVFWSALVGIAITTGWAFTAWIARTGFDEITVASHSFSRPVGDAVLYLMTSSAGGSVGFGVGSVAGVVAGACIGSILRGQFRWEACDDPRELRRQIFGAVLMGIGAVLALGCTIGQGISAFSVLSFSAPIVFASIFIGAALGLRQLIGGLSF